MMSCILIFPVCQCWGLYNTSLYGSLAKFYLDCTGNQGTGAQMWGFTCIYHAFPKFGYTLFAIVRKTSENSLRMSEEEARWNPRQFLSKFLEIFSFFDVFHVVDVFMFWWQGVVEGEGLARTLSYLGCWWSCAPKSGAMGSSQIHVE